MDSVRAGILIPPAGILMARITPIGLLNPSLTGVLVGIMNMIIRFVGILIGLLGAIGILK